MNTAQNLKYKYNNLDVFGKIIVINIIVFIITLLLKVFRIDVISRYFELPSDFWDFIVQPWSILTYGFLHAGIWHILFNMLMLFYLSRVATNLLRDKMILNVFFLGVISGGTAYLLIANLWPNNFFNTGVPLQGASAGVTALLAFVAIYIPYATIRLFNTWTIKWQHIALFFVILDGVRLLLGINQGGYIAHFGGYILGFCYAKQLQKGTDIGTGFEKFMDNLVALFKPKQKLRTVHRKSKKSKASAQAQSQNAKSVKQQKIDAILDKISKSGYESLTAEEKEFLFKAGE